MLLIKASIGSSEPERYIPAMEAIPYRGYLRFSFIFIGINYSFTVEESRGESDLDEPMNEGIQWCCYINKERGWLSCVNHVVVRLARFAVRISGTVSAQDVKRRRRNVPASNEDIHRVLREGDEVKGGSQ